MINKTTFSLDSNRDDFIQILPSNEANSVTRHETTGLNSVTSHFGHFLKLKNLLNGTKYQLIDSESSLQYFEVFSG
jgi:hypothetical protein